MRRRGATQEDLLRAMAWTVEPGTLDSIGRRSVAFHLALLGPSFFGCSKLEEVAKLKRIPTSTLRAFRSELRRIYGIWPPVADDFSASHQPETCSLSEIDEDSV